MRFLLLIILTNGLLAAGLCGCDSSTAANADAGVGADTSGADTITANTDTSTSDNASSDIPGADATANGDATDGGSSDIAVPGQVWVNEIYAGGNKVNPQTGTDADWFELYNSGSASVDLSGFKVGGLTNGFTGTNNVLPAGTVMPGFSFLVIYYNHFNLGKPVFTDGIKSDGSMALWDPKGVLIDSVDWNEGASPSGASYSRIPDGGANWQTVAPSTPGKPNGK